MRQMVRAHLLCACLVIQCGLPLNQSVAERPNVLFIAVDDLNDWAGYRGNDQVISPHMDRLAGESVWFSKAYCQYPLCGPSRASVMSGMYFHQLRPDKLQMKDDVVAKNLQSMGSRLLHTHFKQNGYKTMAVGKILHRHLPKEHLDASGERGGWDHNVDEKGKRVRTFWNSKTTMTDWGHFLAPEPEMSDSKAAKWAVERLRETHEEPFMLMVGFLRPHVPWYVPKKYFDLYEREKITLPPYKANDMDDVPRAGRDTVNEGYPRTEWAKQNNQWRHIIQSYLASITFVDSKVGEVLEALAASPYRDNTIVVLWSDHGYHLGEKNTFQKHTLWERSAAVPLMIKLPKDHKGKKATGRCDQIVGLIDLYPTLLDLCDLPPNEKVVGRSLKPLLEDPTTEWNHPALTYLKDDGRSIRTHRYRYIEYGDGSVELYDLQKDPNEWVNLASDDEHTGTLKRLQRMLTKSHLE